MAHKNLPDKSQKVKDLLTLDLVRASKEYVCLCVSWQAPTDLRNVKLKHSIIKICVTRFPHYSKNSTIKFVIKS
jgi:hypothetical protein